MGSIQSPGNESLHLQPDAGKPPRGLLVLARLPPTPTGHLEDQALILPPHGQSPELLEGTPSTPKASRLGRQICTASSRPVGLVTVVSQGGCWWEGD